MNKPGFFISSLGIFWLAPAISAPEVPPEFLACVDETSDARRLACYDEAMRNAREVSPPEAPTAPAPAALTAPVAAIEAVDAAPEATAMPQPAAAPEPKPADATVGAAPASAPAVAAEPVADAEPEPEENEEDEQRFTVREVFQQPRGENGVVLENGQVWQEPTASKYFPVQPGDRVTLKKRFFGGHLLVTESGKALNVTRVR